MYYTCKVDNKKSQILQLKRCYKCLISSIKTPIINTLKALDTKLPQNNALKSNNQNWDGFDMYNSNELTLSHDLISQNLPVMRDQCCLSPSMYLSIKKEFYTRNPLHNPTRHLHEG